VLQQFRLDFQKLRRGFHISGADAETHSSASLRRKLSVMGPSEPDGAITRGRARWFHSTFEIAERDQRKRGGRADVQGVGARGTWPQGRHRTPDSWYIGPAFVVHGKGGRAADRGRVSFKTLTPLLARANPEVIFNFMFDFINRAASIKDPLVVAGLDELIPKGNWRSTLETAESTSSGGLSSEERKAILGAVRKQVSQ
jgi:hypothetical protein